MEACDIKLCESRCDVNITREDVVSMFSDVFR